MHIFTENEISVFVELAGTTLGEDDLAIQRSLHLHNALNGYIPFLYDFDTENSDYDGFLKTCNKVWKSLEMNPELSENMVNLTISISKA